MLTDKNSITDHFTHLSSTYPSQIPITFTTNCHSTHYLDLTFSLNYHTVMYHKIHHHIYQKPHHKYMYPHFSSNHPQHIFTGIIKTETVRYSRLSKTKDGYNFIHKLFTLRLTALDYPYKLITENSYPWLPYNDHKRQLTNKTHCCNSWQSCAPHPTQIPQHAYPKTHQSLLLQLIYTLFYTWHIPILTILWYKRDQCTLAHLHVSWVIFELNCIQ